MLALLWYIIETYLFNVNDPAVIPFPMELRWDQSSTVELCYNKDRYNTVLRQNTQMIRIAHKWTYADIMTGTRFPYYSSCEIRDVLPSQKAGDV